MRKVKVFKYERTKEPKKYHMEKVPDGEALFHKWGLDVDEEDNGIASYSTAIIERSDGSIETPMAHLVQFTEPAILKENPASTRPTG